MKRIVAIALVGGLIGGLAYAPAVAKKKPKPKVKIVAEDVKYFMHRNSCGTSDDIDDVWSLSTADGPDAATGCGSAYSGIPNEAAITADGAPLSSYVWVATDGVPFTLNATKDITGEITLHSSGIADGAPMSGGAGQTTLEVTLTGTAGGEAKTLGTAESTYQVTPDKSTYTSQLTMTPAADLNKLSFTSLELTTTVRGASINHGYFELDNPASFFSIPTLVKKKK